MKVIIKSLLVGFFVHGVSLGYAQDFSVKPLSSPLGMSTFKYENTYIKITYGRSSKRNRVIFGELVPYEKVWRTGANEATEITFTQDVRISGNVVKQGTYALFTIPQKNRWTIILNSELGQWGAFKYDDKKDVLRFDIPSYELPNSYETFTIELTAQDPLTGKPISERKGSIAIIFKWDKTVVIVPVELFL